MQIVTRFAPSPTGRLHLGHAFSALMAHDFARERDGAFLLGSRISTPGRSRPEYVDGIIEDMLWLGLEWDDEIIYQSERLDLYAEALERLKAGGPRLSLHLHARRHRRQRERAAWRGRAGLSGDLPGRAVDLSRPACLAAGHGEGESRGRLSGTTVTARSSPIRRRSATSSSPARTRRPAIISPWSSTMRRRASPTWCAAATSSPRPMSTACSRRCSICRRPHYHHHALLTDEDGKRLAKRHGAPTLADLRAEGADPADLVVALRAQAPK